MSVKIIEISPNRLEVNGKLVYRNTAGEWVNPSNNLTPSEERALYEFVRAIDLKIENRKN